MLTSGAVKWPSPQDRAITTAVATRARDIQLALTQRGHHGAASPRPDRRCRGRREYGAIVVHYGGIPHTTGVGGTRTPVCSTHATARVHVVHCAGQRTKSAKAACRRSSPPRPAPVSMDASAEPATAPAMVEAEAATAGSAPRSTAPPAAAWRSRRPNDRSRGGGCYGGCDLHDHRDCGSGQNARQESPLDSQGARCATDEWSSPKTGVGGGT
jgi:hypothetical protein